jgi:hypothetical protein
MNEMRRSGVISVGVVFVTSVAWLAIANHCALASLDTPAEKAVAWCHANCCGDQSPAKEKNKNETECCKTLHATLNVAARKLVGYDASLLTLQPYFVAPVILANEPKVTLRGGVLDTGPPFAKTFAESILQRSILAHAPPALA